MIATSMRLLLLLCFLPLLSPCNHKEKAGKMVRLAYLQSDLHHLPAFVALEKGFYQQEGIEVEVSGIFKAGPELMSAFAAGSLDVGYVGLSPATVAVANKTAQVKIIAQVNKNGSAIVVRKDDPFQKLADLKGKLIAIPGHSTIQDFLLRKALSDFGLNDIMATIITIKPPEMISTLSNKQIDAFIAWEPYPAMAINKNVGKVLMYSKDIWLDHPCCVLIVSKQFIEDNSSKLNVLLKAHRKSINYIENNISDAVTIGVKYTGFDERTIKLALQNIQFDHHLSISQASEYIKFINKLSYAKITNPQTFIQSLTLIKEKKVLE